MYAGTASRRSERVTGSDGGVRGRCRQHCKPTLMRLFGEVSLKRMGYGAWGAESIFPLDGELNLRTD